MKVTADRNLLLEATRISTRTDGIQRLNLFDYSEGEIEGERSGQIVCNKIKQPKKYGEPINDPQSSYFSDNFST